jgi:hypothetical protein
MPRNRPNNTPGKFSIAKMRDVVAECADIMATAIAEQYPNIDADALESDLRDLAKRHGTGQTEVTPSETHATVDDKPQYSLAGDMLVLAYDAAMRGDWQSAFRSFATAVESDDMADLVGGIEGMNSQTQVSEDAENLDDPAEDDEEVSDASIDEAAEAVASEMDDSDMDEDESPDDPAENDDDDGDEPLDDEDMEAESSDEDMAEFENDDEESDFDNEDDDVSVVTAEDDDEDDGSDEPDNTSVPMGGASSGKPAVTSSVKGKLAAIANKLSLSGEKGARAEAQRILQNKKGRRL